MTEFTKGDWWHEDGFIRGDHQVVAQMFDAGDETEANARLIAAAPEMYEALKEMNSLIEKMQSAMVSFILPDSEKTNRDFIGEIIEFLDGPMQREAQGAAETALAKARGE